LSIKHLSLYKNYSSALLAKKQEKCRALLLYEIYPTARRRGLCNSALLAKKQEKYRALLL